MTETNRETDRYSTKHVRGSLGHFLMGRTLTALAGFTATILVVRGMPPGQYAAYVVIMGLIVLLGGVSTLGLKEVVQRFLPEFSIQGRQRLVRRFLLGTLTVQAVSLVACTAIYYLAVPHITSALSQVPWTEEFRTAWSAIIALTFYSILSMIIEALMLQRLLKWLWTLVSLVRLCLIAWQSHWAGGLTLEAMVHIEALAHGLGVVCMFIPILILTLRPGERQDEDDSPVLGRIIPFAAYNYCIVLAQMLQGSAVNKLIASRFLPVNVLANFGFAQTLADMSQRYLPNFLLLNLVRPAIIARYSRGTDTDTLLHHANIFTKLNLFLLAPLALWTAVNGRGLTSMLSDGRYGDAGPVLLALILLLAMQCHNRRLELMAQAVERNRLLFIGNLSVVISLVPAILLTPLWGVWGILAPLGGGYLARDIVITAGLRRGGMPSGTDLRGLAVLAASAALPYFPLAAVFGSTRSMPGLLLSGTACLVCFLAVAALLRPFTSRERQAINSITGRKVFVW